jgi:hypothetical protein
VKNAENKLIFGGENRQNKLIDENKLFVGRKNPPKINSISTFCTYSRAAVLLQP